VNEPGSGGREATGATPLDFTLLADDPSGARRGKLRTRRGTVETPAFLPVGTAGSVKGLLPEEVRDLGAEMILANTYHLSLRPGEEVVRQLGGLHRFTGWDGPILTDSGGYQVFSMEAIREIDEDGVTFRSHLDGATRRLSPASSIRIQEVLGSDVMMAFDDCATDPRDRELVARAVDRTARWAEASLRARRDPTAALFGIVQGGTFAALRTRSLSQIISLPFDGYAVGGVSVGETTDEIRQTVSSTVPRLPRNRPRYLMGVGLPDDLVESVASGVDLFDCVVPTRHARNGQLFTRAGRINIRNTRHRDDPGPVDDQCRCPVCRRFSRGYLRHLFMAREILGPRLNTMHNLFHYLELMVRMRTALERGRFRSFLDGYRSSRQEAEEVT
jgi:queuine tRNA-ribosyltransferase